MGTNTYWPSAVCYGGYVRPRFYEHPVRPDDPHLADKEASSQGLRVIQPLWGQVRILADLSKGQAHTFLWL